MKRISLFILFFVSLFFAKAQNIGIGESSYTPDGSSILEIRSTSKGLLIPRMTKIQRDNISNPAFGLVVFQTDNNPGIYFNSGSAFLPTWDKIVIEEEITDMHQAVTIAGQDYLVLNGQQLTAQLINLGTHVTGVLPLVNGGTGANNAAGARTNLGLGNSAVLNVGTTTGTVAAGDHTHANYSLTTHTHSTLTRGNGLTGSNYDGGTATTWAVDYGGTGTATTVSRSDHNHTGTYDNYANWKLQGSGLNESNVTSGTTINITGSGATTVSKSGNTITISSTDNNNTYTASNGITLNTANFELTGQALALHNLATNGLIVRTGAGTVNGRTITWSGNGGSITNGDGVAGNPSISLSIGTGATQVAAGNHTHDAADVISGEFNRARVRKMTSADTRATNPEPQSYEPALQADFKQNTTDGLSDGGTYHGVISFRPYGSTTDFSGGQMHQMGFTDNGNLWMRKSTGIASWGSWQKLLTSTDIGTISGTQNYISKFTSSNALGNSLLFDNGTSIGIGTATPGATNKLDISYTTGSSGGKGINVSISGNASWSSPDIGLSSSVANSNASLGYGVYGQSTSSSASSGRNWGIYGYAHNGGTNVGTAGYVTSTSGNNAGILGVLNGYESFDVATTMSGSWAGFFSGPVKTTGQFTSSLATGTSPFNVTSTTVNTNLNADLLDGNHASAFQTALTNPVTGTGSSGHVSYWNGATTQTYDSDGNFFWDATNNRLGIGTTGPSQKLHISGGNILNEGILYQNTSLGQGSGAHGISWYNPSFYTWFDYMAPAGATNAPSGTAAPSDASSNVTTWARRFNIENINGYGWLFESGTNASGSAPTVKFAISSNTGTFHSTGNANIDGTVNAGSYAVLGTGINGGYYQDATNGAYRSIVAASTTNGYYFQTNTGATTTMYVGLGGSYNGNVGIGTTTPTQRLVVNGGNIDINASGGGLRLGANNWSDGGATYGHIINDNSSYQALMIVGNNTAGDGHRNVRIWDHLNVESLLTRGGNLVWDAGNDGSGTGLDADLLDGNHASAFAAASHTHLWSQVTSKPADWLDAANLIQDNGNFNNSVPSGFYQGYGSTNAPTGSTWYNMINVRHSNTGNDHGFQIAASYYDENIWTRTYQGGSGANNGTFTPWRALIHTGNIVSQVTAAGFIPNNGNGDWQIASNSTGTSYNLATLELRESNFTANGSATPPRLGFHWGGVVASQIGIESSGRIVILNNPGTAYENLAAKDLYLSGQITVAGGSPAVGKVLTSDASGLGTWNYPTATVSSTLHPSMDDITGWTTVNSTQVDDATYTVNWGFNFTIEGVNYTQGWISTNGILGFGSSSTTAYTNSSLPISNSSDPMLFFHWDDHYGRNIRYVVIGTSPSRICFIEWEGFPRSGTFGNAANYVHAYITLHEGSNVVSVRYLNQGSNADAQGASATFGFQYAGGSSAKTIPMGYNTKLLDDNATNQQFSIDF